jgi:2-oxoglutarate dehydrogenase E2 component (dihydrolipoamide succinyltransferase)
MLMEIRTPTIETSEAKCSIGRWFKRVGDPVTIGEPLVEIETNDQTIEVQAPVTGVLSQIFLKDGQFITTSKVLGTITDYDDSSATVKSESPSR